MMAEQADTFDIIVIGAGIAGASSAAEMIADGGRILLLEAEDQPGYHSTGRSAAVYTCAYGPPVIRALTRASGDFYRNPQSPHIDHPLLRRRGVLFVATAEQGDALAELESEMAGGVRRIDIETARSLVPLLRPEYAVEALIEDDASDIDVMALHQHYLKSFRAAGGVLKTSARVTALRRDGEQWQVETTAGDFTAPTIVNAAGAWADQIARLAGVVPIGLVPKRRTALLVDPPAGTKADDWPISVDAEEQFYMKPDAGKLLISPADETPSEPCDAQPDELDVAICVDRVETAFDVSVRRIDHKWAGLRSFVADRSPVIGFDPEVSGFFWLAGQGGYGIQSAPAAARTAAALVRHLPIPDDLLREGVTEAALSPGRDGLRA